MGSFFLPGWWIPGHSRRKGCALVAVLGIAFLQAGCGGGHGDGAAPVVDAAQPAAAASASPERAANESEAPSPSGTVGGGATVGIIDALNEARASPRDCGTTRYPAALPLAVDSDVEESATAHTRWMQANRTMSHTGAGGSSVGNRLSETGYRWSAVGENVAMGQAAPAAVVAAWLASPGHCANIMNATFVDAGFGFAPGAGGAPTYATLVLARPR